MNSKLSPTEFIYLKRPFWSEGEDMIKSTLQELCMKNSLNIEERWIFVDKRDNKKRKRYFLKTAEHFDQNKPYNKAETFLIKAFGNRNELSLGQLKYYIRKQLKKSNTQIFKDEYVYFDMKAKGMLIFSWLPTKEAKKAKNELSAKLEYININIDNLIKDNTLASELEAIGQNIVMLKKETLKKITTLNKDILNINVTGLLLNQQYLSFPMLASFDGISSFDFASDSGFEGFGGGDFGGGGAGDSW